MEHKISIIIPAYNVAAHLPTAVGSILAQTYRNLEIIIVQDGSTDNTAQVCDALANTDSRIRVIHKENGGVTSARLRGVEEATGDYIGFADGDDFAEPDMYERLLNNALTYQADISHCGYRMVFGSGKVEFHNNTGALMVQDREQGVADLLMGTVVEPGLWNKLYRRELFAGLSTWMDRSIRINEDALMNFYLFRKADQAVFEDFCPYHYVLRSGSAMVSQLNEHKLADPLNVFRRILEESADHPLWHAAALQRLVYLLIGNATMSYGQQRALIAPHRRSARKELRQRLGAILTCSECGMKLKLMALWAAILPGSYSLVHRIYGKLTGTDKKYSMD